MKRQEEIRVLIVDDEPAIRMLLEEFLGAEGYLCKQAETVEQAIARLAGEKFHLVLSDLRMPGMDGFDLLRHVRQMEEETGVLMVSAVDEIDTAVQLLRDGAYDYLLKPFRPDDVVQRVRAAAERVLLTRENRRYSMHLRDEVERRTEELRASQDDLRTSETHRRLLLEQAGEAFLTLDANTGRILEANPCAANLLGAGRGELNGRLWSDLDPSDCLNQIDAADTKNFRKTLLLPLKNSGLGEVELSATKIQAPEGPVLFLVLRETDPNAGRWPEDLGTLSHELRTPLNAILGHAEILDALGFNNPDQTDRSLRNIRRNARQSLRLVEDLLDLSRRIENSMDLQTGPVEIGQVLQEITETLRPLAEECELHMEWVEDSSIPPLETDSGALSRIILALGSNALHYTRSGGVRIRARFDQHSLLIRVIDSGIGICPEDQQRVFGRGERARSGRIAGAGIGLAIAQRIAKAMGGEIKLWSKFGLGSVFSLHLPVKALTESGFTHSEWVETA